MSLDPLLIPAEDDANVPRMRFPNSAPPPGLGPVDPNGISIDQVTYEADQVRLSRPLGGV